MAEIQNINKRLEYDKVRDRILNGKMDVNTQYPGISDFDAPILEIAIKKHDTELIDYLLQHNVDVNRNVRFRKPAIYLAVNSDDIDLTQKLLNAGVIWPPEEENGERRFSDNQLLGVALRKNNKEMVQLLLETFVHDNDYIKSEAVQFATGYSDPELLFSISPHSSLLAAIEQNKIEVLKRLISQNFYYDSRKILLYATGHVSCEIAGFLTDRDPYSVEDLMKVLHNAIGCENIPTVELLIRKGANANASPLSVKEALEIACDKKNIKIIEILIAAGFDATKTFDINTSLHIAIIQNDYEKIKNLIVNGVDINGTSYFKKTPLILAVEVNNKPVVELLLKNGSKPEQAAIFAAIKNDDLESVKILIDAGVYIFYSAIIELMKNVIYYTNECKRSLLTRDAFIRSENGDSGPLQIATCRRYGEFIKLLIKNGADVNCKIEFRGSPLDIACKNNDLGLVKVLVEAGANVQISLHEYSLIESAINHKNYQLAEYLVNHCTSANITCDYSAALICAVERKRKEIAELLIKNGANINYTPLYQLPALCHSIRYCVPEITEILVKAGADLNLNLKYNTPLIEAIKLPDYKMTQYLIENGADVDANINNIGSLLNWAFRRCKPAVISLALDIGADINAVNENGETAIDFFSNTQNTQTLIEHVIKLKAANLYLIEKNLDAVEGIQFDDFYSECLNEVNLMKTQWFAWKKSFYHILHFSVNKLSRNIKYLKKDDIIFDKSALCSKFKLYGKIIYYRVLRAESRNELLASADKIMTELFSDLLPDIIRQDVLDYLNYNNLRILINKN